MIVTCDDCKLEYDDVYRLTYCPHERFDMHTTVANSKGVVGVARTVEELRRMMKYG